MRVSNIKISMGRLHHSYLKIYTACNEKVPLFAHYLPTY